MKHSLESECRSSVSRRHIAAWRTSCPPPGGGIGWRPSRFGGQLVRSAASRRVRTLSTSWSAERQPSADRCWFVQPRFRRGFTGHAGGPRRFRISCLPSPRPRAPASSEAVGSCFAQATRPRLARSAWTRWNGAMTAGSPPSCQLCGRVAEPGTEGEVILSWMMDRQDGQVRWTCPGCAAANARSMEAKLEPEWW